MRAAGRRWTHSDELLALIWETLDVLLRVTITANSKKRPKLGKPVHYERPSEREKKRKPFAGMPGVKW